MRYRSQPVRFGAPRAPRRSRILAIAIVDATGHPTRTAPGLAKWLQQVAPAAIQGSVTIALVSDRRMRMWNRAYRGADYATDVLSFPADSDPEYLGDIAIATRVAARQARERGHSLRTELRILALHGLLHLAGFDHEADHGEMAVVERRLRRKGGLREGLIERGVSR